MLLGFPLKNCWPGLDLMFSSLFDGENGGGLKLLADTIREGFMKRFPGDDDDDEDEDEAEDRQDGDENGGEDGGADNSGDEVGEASAVRPPREKKQFNPVWKLGGIPTRWW